MLNDAAIEKMQNQFKVCLMANLVSVLLMFVSAILVEYTSKAWAPTTATNESYAWFTYAHLVATRVSLVLGLPAFLVAIAGMIQFRWWARQLYFWLTIASALEIAGFLLFNINLVWGMASIFGYFACLSTGAVLAMSYLTPLTKRFERTHARPSVAGPVGVSIG